MGAVTQLRPLPNRARLNLSAGPGMPNSPRVRTNEGPEETKVWNPCLIRAIFAEALSTIRSHGSGHHPRGPVLYVPRLLSCQQVAAKILPTPPSFSHVTCCLFVCFLFCALDPNCVLRGLVERCPMPCMWGLLPHSFRVGGSQRPVFCG